VIELDALSERRMTAGCGREPINCAHRLTDASGAQQSRAPHRFRELIPHAASSRHALMAMIALAFLQARRLKAAGSKKSASPQRRNQAC
jgi:hypothetical protein